MLWYALYAGARSGAKSGMSAGQRQAATGTLLHESRPGGQHASWPTVRPRAARTLHGEFHPGGQPGNRRVARRSQPAPFALSFSGGR
jgi:hypothetical protein